MGTTWDERYSNEEYHYGKEPNQFFKEELNKIEIKGNLLLPAEGEGRNAVYAACQGWDVTAFDSSKEGRNKAIALAREFDTSISYYISDYKSFQAKENYFECIGLIYTHMPSDIRKNFYKKIINWLKP